MPLIIVMIIMIIIIIINYLLGKNLPITLPCWQIILYRLIASFEVLGLVANTRDVEAETLEFHMRFPTSPLSFEAHEEVVQ
jgi:hypothetical protein